MLKLNNISLKTIWLKLKTKLGGKPVWQIQEGAVIEPAFIAGGVQYYCIKDQFATFTLRGMAAIEVYDKWNMRMDRDLLKQYITKLKELFTTSGTIDLVQAVTLLNGMQERMDWVIAPKEYLWDLFCVTYFDKSESPYSYDSEYQHEKKRRLKASGEIDDFFLYTRLSELIPMPKLSASDLETAFRVIQAVEIYNSRNHLSGKRPEPQRKDSSLEPNLKNTTEKI